MILFALVIVHMLVVLLMFALMTKGVLKIDRYMLLVAACIPVFGVLCALLITVMMKMGMVGVKNGDLEIMKESNATGADIVVEGAESADIVPLEDALIMDDPSVRRSVMLDVLMSDSKGYMPVINRARMNDDVEVVHYATTAMVELSKEYELKLQEYSAQYAENPRKPGLLNEYIEFLDQYIRSGMIQGQLLEIQINTYQQLLAEKVSVDQKIGDYENLVKAFFESGQYSGVDTVLSKMEEKWPRSDRCWLLRFRYYVETGVGNKVKEMIEEVSGSEDYYSKEIRDIVSFWMRSEGEAGV